MRKKEKKMSYFTIWMGDLPPETRREHVVKFFEDYGTLGGIRLMNNFGFVDFKHKARFSSISTGFTVFIPV